MAGRSGPSVAAAQPLTSWTARSSVAGLAAPSIDSVMRPFPSITNTYGSVGRLYALTCGRKPFSIALSL